MAWPETVDFSWAERPTNRLGCPAGCAIPARPVKDSTWRLRPSSSNDCQLLDSIGRIAVKIALLLLSDSLPHGLRDFGYTLFWRGCPNGRQRVLKGDVVADRYIEDDFDGDLGLVYCFFELVKIHPDNVAVRGSSDRRSSVCSAFCNAPGPAEQILLRFPREQEVIVNCLDDHNGPHLINRGV